MTDQTSDAIDTALIQADLLRKIADGNDELRRVLIERAQSAPIAFAMRILLPQGGKMQIPMDLSRQRIVLSATASGIYVGTDQSAELEGYPVPVVATGNNIALNTTESLWLFNPAGPDPITVYTWVEKTRN